MVMDEKISPFQPGEPVKPEKFQGRQKIIDKYSKFLYESSKGKSHHFFITGKRGMGKTSLARYLNECARHRYKMIGVHIVNEGIHDIDSLIIQIVENLLNEIEDEKWAEKIVKGFKDHVDKVGLFGVTLQFKPGKDLLNNLRNNFAHFLIDLIGNFKDKNGIFIIIDDINGLSKTAEFANWYKSFTDTLATSFSNPTPIAMMLTGYSEKLEALSQHNESFPRIFKHDNIGSLSKEEIKNFFIETFGQIDIKIEKQALNLMAHFSSGLPTMMQEIGDGVFWFNDGNIINRKDAFRGILRAGEEIGVKYLKPALDKSIKSDKYLDIFDKLGIDFVEHNIDQDYSFRKRDFKDKLNEDEINVFSDFLIRARSLNIIEFTGATRSGHYKFTNNLYPLYFFIRSSTRNET